MIHLTMQLFRCEFQNVYSEVKALKSDNATAFYAKNERIENKVSSSPLELKTIHSFLKSIYI